MMGMTLNLRSRYRGMFERSTVVLKELDCTHDKLSPGERDREPMLSTMQTLDWSSRHSKRQRAGRATLVSETAQEQRRCYGHALMLSTTRVAGSGSLTSHVKTVENRPDTGEWLVCKSRQVGTGRDAWVRRRGTTEVEVETESQNGWDLRRLAEVPTTDSRCTLNLGHHQPAQPLTLIINHHLGQTSSVGSAVSCRVVELSLFDLLFSISISRSPWSAGRAMSLNNGYTIHIVWWHVAEVLNSEAQRASHSTRA
ncbi:hypothetical protein B0T21DRAFT_392860 [Apiosordaria backusii]|uniref:Uncharacterized protein n=1 Tax=Apiosordaria backusii TaxID=314023 RepID=A0AA40BKR7_9PEZI|nr:hypothetical protein B0T21DRAFT_392860 [Apiosordaria backusii]